MADKRSEVAPPADASDLLLFSTDRSIGKTRVCRIDLYRKHIHSYIKNTYNHQLHYVQIKEAAASCSIIGGDIFFLVISRICSGVRSITRQRIRSAAANFFISLIKASLEASRLRLIKSIKIVPERFRSRNCLEISFADSRFRARNVSSLLFLPEALPVLTSMQTKASVCWITRKPPLFSQIFSRNTSSRAFSSR